MKSNYIFLKNNFPEIFRDIREIEVRSNNYKLQTRELISLMEKMLRLLDIEIESFNKNNNSKLYCAINEISNKLNISSELIETMHFIRKKGNKAKHVSDVLFQEDSVKVQKKFFEFTKWWYKNKTGVEVLEDYTERDELDKFLQKKILDHETLKLDSTSISECDSFFRS